MSQRVAILELLIERGGHGVCVSDVPLDVGYTLRNRISELITKDGVNIRKERCKMHKHGSTIMRYTLIPRARQPELPYG